MERKRSGWKSPPNLALGSRKQLLRARLGASVRPGSAHPHPCTAGAKSYVQDTNRLCIFGTQFPTSFSYLIKGKLIAGEPITGSFSPLAMDLQRILLFLDRYRCVNGRKRLNCQGARAAEWLILATFSRLHLSTR